MTCPRCDGHGFLLRQVPTTIYMCGFYRTARLCPTCRGEKIIPTPVPQPCAAAGEREDTA